MNSCRDCTERHIGCHSKCEKYRKWKIEFNKRKRLAKSEERKHYDYFYHD